MDRKDLVEAVEASLSSADQEKLWLWNSTVPPAQSCCVHEIFQDTARRLPSAAAVCSWDNNFTYNELDSLSTKLARHLNRLGVGQETPVIVCFDKSAWAVVATLGVLKAGGAFVPVGAGKPDDRTSSILQQTKSHLVLTQQSYLKHYTGLVHKAIAVDDRLFKTIPKSNPQDFTIISSLHQSAYIIFTSGSTGKPKGVVVEHAAASTSILSQAERFQFSPSTRQLQFSSYVFDMSVSETFATLLKGGCLCIPSEAQRLEDLAGAISTMRVNAAILTPTMARRLDPSHVPTLQSLAMGAEMITASDMTQWSHLPRLYQGYGPTECAAVTHTHTVADAATNPHTIGTATGCVGWIVDPDNDQRLMPIGQVGELAIEGHILARGYLGDPVKTEAAFIKDPIWLLKGSSSHAGRQGRLYKTGDLVYYNPDGTCEIIGRKDTQVKIRGQRVELTEVETSLKRVFPEADDIIAEMITPQDSDGPVQLAAFLTGMPIIQDEVGDGFLPLQLTAQQRELLATTVRAVLRPSFFIAIDEIPTTSSGKLDRKRLREFASSRQTEDLLPLSGDSDKDVGSSITEVSDLKDEHLVRRLWSHCLHIDEDLIRPDSDFFSLGGSSISAIELIAKARKHGIQWKMLDIFEKPTLAEQIATIAPKPKVFLEPEIIAPFALLPEGLKLPSVLKKFKATYGLDPQDIEDIYPCTPAQEHLMTVTTYRTHAFTLQIGMRVRHQFDIERVKSAVAQVFDALPLLRTRILRLPLGPMVQVVMKEPMTWQYGTSFTEYLAKDSKKHIDYGSPLARFGLVHDLNEEWFVLTLHHALWDRWSLPFMLNMFGQAYHGQELPHAPLLKNFIDAASSIGDSTSHRFWDSYLEHPTWNNFPKIPAGITTPRATEVIRRRFAKPSITAPGMTLSIILRATWALLQSRGSGSGDILFGTTVFGRNCPLPAVEAVIGPTIATVPVRVQVSEHSSITEYLKVVQQGVFDSAQHEHAWLKKFSESSARKQSNTELNAIFVVQPREHQKLVNPFNDGDEALWLLGAFDDHALLIQCEIFAEHVVITANFDTRIVRPLDVKETLDAFEPTCSRLASGGEKGSLDTLATDVQRWRSPKPDAKDVWWRWLLCCIVIYGTSFLYGLDFTIVACMQGSIVATFGSATDLTWIGSGFPLGSLILILPVGYVFGLFENRYLYAGSIIVFLVGSVVCGAAPNVGAIIAGRLIAGAGGGGMYLGALNSIGSLTKRRERTVYAAFTGFFYGIGVILGPIIGGSIANSSLTWRWGFYIITIVAGLLLLATPTLPTMEPRPGVAATNKLMRMDWIGALIFAGITVAWSVIFTAGGSDWSWLNARTWVLLAIFVVAVVLFAVQQYYRVLTSETWKIFPLEFLSSRAMTALFVATAASAAALYITTYYTPLIFQYARGDSPITSSVRIIPMMALFIVSVVLQGVFMPMLGAYMPWYIVGGVFLLVGGALMCTVTSATSAAAIQGYTVLIGFGGGLCLQAAYAITTAKVKGEKLSSAISFINVAQIGAGVISLSTAGAIYQNIGTQRLQAILPPQTLASSNATSYALTGLSSPAFQAGDVSVQVRQDVDVAITETISKIFILVAVAGGVVLLSGLAMPFERLFYTKKHGKGGGRFARSPRSAQKVNESAV